VRLGWSKEKAAVLIRLSRLDGSEFYLNSDLIQSVESKPDTHIVLTTGTKYVVREADTEVVKRVVDFRRAINRPLASGRKGQLRLVNSEETGS